MDTNHRAPRRLVLARFIAAASLATLGVTRGAHADSPLVLTLVPKHVFSARGFSVRSGDYFALEPAFLFVGDVKPGSRPIAGVEAHIERMYGPTDWRSATYLGPQLSLSVYVLKASIGVMTNMGDQRDRRGQLGIGGGF